VKRRPNTQAFTLIELLVVLAIIALLAAMLWPALARAKLAAQRADCLSRLKQWTQACFCYAQDHNEWLAREGCNGNGNVQMDSWARVQAPQSADAWYNALPTYVGRPPASAYATSPEDFYARGTLFHCLAAPLPGRTVRTLYPYPFFSLAMNSQLIEVPDVPSLRLHRISRPPQTVLYLDNLLNNEPVVVDGQARSDLGQPAAYANRFAGRRHGRGGNLAFADGRIATFPGEKVVETKGPNRGWDIVPPVDVFWRADTQ
jgi:prepilin-type N-terminal cleavage/methylation domain-containing protein/prepilin-type processing-associated H-X9-DG protein